MPNIIDFGKEKKIHIKRLILLMVAIVFLFSLAIPVSAEPETVLTGCLNKSSGVLHKVALGLKPVSACNPAEVQVTWSSGVPDLEGRIVALEERIAGMESDLVPLDLTVHCPEESVGEALAQAGDRTAHVTITIIGVCTEEVLITRDNTTLQGASPGDGLQAASPDDFVLSLLGARGINLEQLTITGGNIGLHATEGATFRAKNLHVSGASDQCVATNRNATGWLLSSTMENCPDGLRAVWGGSVRMIGGLINNSEETGISTSLGGNVSVESGAVIRNSGTGIYAENGGAIEVTNGTIEYNGTGVFAFFGGYITIKESLVQYNNKGVGAHGNGTVWLKDGTIVSNNQSGVWGRVGSTLILGEVTIENNRGDGIDLGGGSTASISRGTIVRNNIGHGIALGATSSATFFDDTVQVTGNTGTAVICGTVGQLDDVALIVGEPGLISGNGSDTIECPRGFP